MSLFTTKTKLHLWEEKENYKEKDPYFFKFHSSKSHLSIYINNLSFTFALWRLIIAYINY